MRTISPRSPSAPEATQTHRGTCLVSFPQVATAPGLVRVRIEVAPDADAKEKSVEGTVTERGDPSGPADVEASQIFVTLPEQPVRAGDEWSVEGNVGPFGLGSSRSRYRYLGSMGAGRPGLGCIALTTHTVMPAGHCTPGVELDAVTTIVIELDTGVPVSIDQRTTGARVRQRRDGSGRPAHREAMPSTQFQLEAVK